jgi:hypothetical protein
MRGFLFVRGRIQGAERVRDVWPVTKIMDGSAPSRMTYTGPERGKLSRSKLQFKSGLERLVE